MGICKQLYNRISLLTTTRPGGYEGKIKSGDKDIMTAKEYWEELNREYGLDLEMPEEIKLDIAAVQNDMAMGMSFDAAMQNNMEI